MLRGVKPVGQGAGASAGRLAGRGRRSRGASAAVVFTLAWTGCLLAVFAGAGHAAEPFPPSEASEHFDAQARASKKDLLATLQADSRFQMLVQALNTTGMAPLLRTRGPLTLFVPTDAAFDKLMGGKREQFLKQPGILKALLRHHILRAYVPTKQLSRLRNALTASGYTVNIDGNSGIKVNGAAIIEGDMHASNGVIHVIDTVLVPPEAKSKSKSRRKGKGAAGGSEAPSEPGDGEEKKSADGPGERAGTSVGSAGAQKG